MSLHESICIVDTCTLPQVAKKMCKKHYMQLYRKSDTARINHGEQNRRWYEKNKSRILAKAKERHPLYQTWASMINRCTNSANAQFEYYGARGIYVCNRWRGKDGFDNFVEDMGDKPNGCSLDRIDNNGGYEKSNCRWASYKIQQINRRLSRNNKSGYTGVYFDRRRRVYIATLGSMVVGRSTDKSAAIHARRSAYQKYYEPLLCTNQESRGENRELSARD